MRSEVSFRVPDRRRWRSPASAVTATLAAQAPAPAAARSRVVSARPVVAVAARRVDARRHRARGRSATACCCSRRPASPAGPIRRPGALAILKTPPLGDASIDVELRSDAPEDVIRRDLLLVAGWQSPTRLYYVHLSADPRRRPQRHLRGRRRRPAAHRRQVRSSRPEGPRLAYGPAGPDGVDRPAGGVRRRRDRRRS